MSAATGVADHTAAQFRTSTGTGTEVRQDDLGSVALAPAAASGVLTSRILDARQMVTWDRLTYRADVPAGTSLRISVRTGSTATPDATWSAWVPVSQGGRVVASSRYLQYRLELATAQPTRTPVLRDIAITNDAVPVTPIGEH